MKENFNDLTPAQAERLAYLVEELGEAIQAIGKILRHGYASYNPDDVAPRSLNRTKLACELSDVLRAIDRMTERGDIDKNMIEGMRMADRTNRYMHHQAGGK